MKEAEHVSVNCFSQPPPPQKREEQVKKILLDAKQRRRANKEIDNLLDLHRGKSIQQLLPAMKRKGFPRYIIEVAIERVRRRLKDDDVVGKAELMAFETSLAEVD